MSNISTGVYCLFTFRIICSMYRNEKRRIESTGEAPSWQYYHEVDELLGSHADNPMDSSNFDDNNMANSSSISEFICKIQYTFALNPSFFLFIQTFFQQSTRFFQIARYLNINQYSL